MNEQAHDRMVVELEKVYKKLDKAIEECKNSQYESEQQARLLGMSAERELALRSKIFDLERKIQQLESK